MRVTLRQQCVTQSLQCRYDKSSGSLAFGGQPVPEVRLTDDFTGKQFAAVESRERPQNSKIRASGCALELADIGHQSLSRDSHAVGTDDDQVGSDLAN